MKKIIVSTVLIMMTCLGFKVSAQNCTEIVRPYLEFRNIPPSAYPEPKFEWRCHFSYNTFYLCDSVPEGATVFGIQSLTNLITGEHPAENYVVDLEVFSYWAWDFSNFQFQDPQNTIYFDTHNSTNRYLAVRTYSEASQRAQEQLNQK